MNDSAQPEEFRDPEVSVIAAYTERYPELVAMGESIRVALVNMLKDYPRIDAVTVRAKSVESFAEKAQRVKSDGTKKYIYPLQEIEDQIGARVVVYYKSDVRFIADLIFKEFRIIQAELKKSAEPDRFGYEATHYVCPIPLSLGVGNECPIEFFELQVSTLFQHAWAQANHDLGYKRIGESDFDKQRRIAWAAAQAYGADTVFEELWNPPNKN